jgi:competence transcription factor ComK
MAGYFYVTRSNTATACVKMTGIYIEPAKEISYNDLTLLPAAADGARVWVHVANMISVILIF